MRILITGSTGFIGGSVGRFASLAGHDVIGIARRKRPDPDWRGGHIAADVAQADLAGIINEVNPDAVFHAAGTASVAASFTSPLDDLRAAAITWANLLDGVRRSTIRPRLIFPSSAAVYGNPDALPVSEDAFASPISPYGFHKLTCETIAMEYAACFGLDILICRIFSVIGPTQRRLLVWEIYEQLIAAGLEIQLKGTGDESRDYLHVDDVAAAVLALAKAERGPNVAQCATFNLASGVETRVANLAEEMCRIVAPAKGIRFLARNMTGNPARWLADTAKIRSAIPTWESRPMSETLAQCIAQWQNEGRRIIHSA